MQCGSEPRSRLYRWQIEQFKSLHGRLESTCRLCLFSKVHNPLIMSSAKKFKMRLRAILRYLRNHLIGGWSSVKRRDLAGVVNKISMKINGTGRDLMNCRGQWAKVALRDGPDGHASDRALLCGVPIAYRTLGTSGAFGQRIHEDSHPMIGRSGP